MSVQLISSVLQIARPRCDSVAVTAVAAVTWRRSSIVIVLDVFRV
jgi:hypothetical protein